MNVLLKDIHLTLERGSPLLRLVLRNELNVFKLSFKSLLRDRHPKTLPITSLTLFYYSVLQVKKLRPLDIKLIAQN